ncbi:MAG: polyphenol oxidase family protein [Clostridia bacterium]|nr:polyphenol oxidase family protein [Clostridia bacterium]
MINNNINFENENIKHMYQDGIEYIQFKKLLNFSEINHAYILKTNNMNFRMGKDFRNLEIVKTNLKKVSDVIGFDFNNIIRPDYEHTNNVEIISFKDETEIPSLSGKMFKDTDGLITDKNEIAIISTNADCNLILIYDPIKGIIGNIHAGWRGTFGKIASKAIRKMKEEYDCNPKDIICCFCPSIRKCHFEVEDDVESKCEEIFKYTGMLDKIISKGDIKNGKQKYYIDTILINKLMLKEEGILDESIIDSGICSVCNKEKVHSKRAEGDNFDLGCALIQKANERIRNKK